MKNSQLPLARNTGLVVQEVPDELLVYDLHNDKAHCLNHTAALVWRSCDGKTAISDIASKLSSEVGENISDDFVWLALDGLSKNDLLEKKITANFAGESRRSVIKKLGLASIVAVPIIASLAAPQNALAVASCACIQASDCAGMGSCGSTNICNCDGLCAPQPPPCAPLSIDRTGAKPGSSVGK